MLPQIPKLSHLQVAILGLLAEHESESRSLRADLKTKGYSPTRPGFHQMMNRLIDKDLVALDYAEVEYNGYMLRQSVYSLTGQGRKVCRELGDYYEATLPALKLAANLTLALVRTMSVLVSARRMCVCPSTHRTVEHSHG